MNKEQAAQPNKREVIARINELITSYTDATYGKLEGDCIVIGSEYSEEQFKADVEQVILALFPQPELKVLSEEDIEREWLRGQQLYTDLHPKSQNIYEKEHAGLRLVAQAQRDYDQEQVKG